MLTDVGAKQLQNRQEDKKSDGWLVPSMIIK